MSETERPDIVNINHVTNVCTDMDRAREFYEDVRDRTYFRSIYLSDPDGLTIEICTEGPGFAVDEEVPGSEFVDPPEGE